jgi:two-component system, sensor histidine kinase and response regulator
MSNKILIVDDDSHLRKAFKDIFEGEGYKVSLADSAQSAMSLIVSSFFDLILVDFSLSDKTGLEVIRDIRRLDKDSQIIMMTTHTALDTAIKAAKDSVYDFLIKPVDFNYLKRVVKKALDKHDLEQKNKRLFAELEIKNEELNRLNDMKSKFLSMASHDLSNALMTLKISFEMLSETLTPDDDQEKQIKYISSGIGQISRLIEDLVDWASIEQGKFRLEKNYFEIQDVANEIIEGPKARAKQRDISMDMQVQSTGSLMVCADKKRISQVYMNLLENAIRHTPKGGKISIIIDNTDDKFARVGIKDSGEGIRKEDAPNLFKSFYQSSSSKGQKGRLGLGLSISKEIVVSHGGDIWVESEGMGKGATFFFTIPLVETPKKNKG